MGKYNVENVGHDANRPTHGCNCRTHEFVFQKAFTHDRKYADPSVSTDVSALIAPTRYAGWSRDEMDMVCKSVFIGPRVGQLVRMYYSTPKLGVGTQLFLNKDLHTNDKMHIDSTGTEGLSLYSWIFSESTNKFYKISGRKIVEVSDICMPEPCNCEEGTMVPHEFFFKRLHRPFDVYRGWTTRDLGGLCEATDTGERIGFPQTLYYSTPTLGLGTVLFSAEVPQIEEPGVFTTVGTVKHIDLEGGFWGIMTPNGGLSGDIPTDFQEDGKRVMVTYKMSDLDVSISMWGTLIDILDISDVDETDETKFKIKLDNQWIYSAINQMFCRIDDRTIVEMRECSEAPIDCICTEEYSPVCGVDKNTYSNACMAGCAGVDIKHQGECEKPVDDCICTREYMPVCGTNGQTYGNVCMAECAGVGILHEGRCVSVDEPVDVGHPPVFRWKSFDNGAPVLQVKNLMKPGCESEAANCPNENRDMSKFSTVYLFNFDETAYTLGHTVWPDAAVIGYVGPHADSINPFEDNMFITFADGPQDAAGNPLPPPEGHDDWRNTGYKQLYLHGQRAMYIFTADGADSENMANLTSSAWPVIRKDEYMEHIQ
jgi:hypothetical protein